MKREEKMKMLAGWRGRRIMACRATDQLELVIDNLGHDDGENWPPPNGLPEVSEEIRREIKNQATVLLRMILAANDGQISEDKLRRF